MDALDPETEALHAQLRAGLRRELDNPSPVAPPAPRARRRVEPAADPLPAVTLFVLAFGAR